MNASERKILSDVIQEAWEATFIFNSPEVRARFHAIHDELRALLAEQPSEGWRPIETAPKDGTRLLAFAAEDVYLVSWSDRWVLWLDDDGAPISNPTHWMPLPPPPSEGREPT